MTNLEKDLKNILQEIASLRSNIVKKLNDPSSNVQIALKETSEKVFTFFSSDGKDKEKLSSSVAQNQAKARFAVGIQREVWAFLQEYAKERLVKLARQATDGHNFIEQIWDIWQNYQRFAYGLRFALHKAENNLKDFHKYGPKFDRVLGQEQAKYKSPFKCQVTPVPVTAVNQLNQFLKHHKLMEDLINKFVIHFTHFMKLEREGANTPREKINESLQFFEALHYDFECQSKIDGERRRIAFCSNNAAPNGRKSTSMIFYKENFKRKINEDCQNYYKNWVSTKGQVMNSAQQIKQMLLFLDNEDLRAEYYIHDKANNKKEYLKIVLENLICFNAETRIQKQSGLSLFLTKYELGDPSMAQQIKSFWKVYSRVYSDHQNIQKCILNIYQKYMEQESKIASKSIDKPPEFIEQTIKVNKKNVEIVQLLGRTLEFDRIRVECLESLLTMKYIAPNPKIKEYFGAKHWASYLNNRLKMKFAKTQKYSQSEADLVNLFKLLIHKTVAINEHTRLLAFRLLEDVDMSLDAQYSNALELESKILEQIRKQTSESDIKSIQNCLKDVRVSFEERSNLKATPAVSKFTFFNQIIKKSGNHWADTASYDIQPPIILRPCIEAIRGATQNVNFIFELQNGTSLFTGTFKNKKEQLKFQFKNIYMIILLLIDQQPNKRIYFVDLVKSIRPVGSEKTLNELIKCFVQLKLFGLLNTNKDLSQKATDIWSWSPGDYLEINANFQPAKKLPSYKTGNLSILPDYIKRTFQMKLSTLEEEERKFQKDRRAIVQGRCVQLLKHAQASQGGKGTISFDQLLNGHKRQNKVTPMYLKQVVEHLINGGYCERVADKRNVFQYKS